MTRVITSESIYQIHGPVGLRLEHSMDTCFTIKNNVRKELTDDICIFEVRISKGASMSWQVSLQDFLRLRLGLDLYHIPLAHLSEVPTGLLASSPVTLCSQMLVIMATPPWAFLESPFPLQYETERCQQRNEIFDNLFSDNYTNVLERFSPQFPAIPCYRHFFPQIFIE